IGATTDPYDPAAVQASAGAIFGLCVARTTPEELRDWKQRHGVTMIGAAPAAATDFRDARYQRPLLIVMGGERHGISPAVAAC
ncbi:TrmH family RNA methyltransferase, partial [Escherichia coli]